MQISEFTLRLVLIFLPGILSYLIIEELTVHRRNPKFYKCIIHSLILGFFCYLVYYLISQKLVMLDALRNPRINVCFKEVLYASLLSIPLGIVISWITNRKLLFRFMRWLHITKRSGCSDVWDYTLDKPTNIWAVVRDRENDLIYEGWIESFSETGEIKELLLRDVKIYRNSTGDFMHETPAIYLSKFDSIEFPLITSS